MIQWNNFSPYGNYRNFKFTDVPAETDDHKWDNVDDFKSDYKGSPLYNNELTDASIILTYYLLYARYGNSTIASSDYHQFKMKLYAIIWQFGPAWQKKLELQKEVRELTLAQALDGTEHITNHALNPENTPATNAYDPLTYINEQTATKVKRGEADALSLILELLDNDVTEEYIRKFRYLFLTVVGPEMPLWYVTAEEDD